MNDLAGFAFWLFSGVVITAIVVAVFWSRVRQQQMRTEVILKLLESGQSLDPATLDKLLAVPGPVRPGAPSHPPDPRAGYRTGNTFIFLIGFGTLLHAFLREAGYSYPLIALGAFAIALAIVGWRVGDKQFRDGTLPTLKYRRDPREAYLNGGVMFFLIGYGTIFTGIVRDAGMSYPVIGLGAVLVAMCFGLWHQGNKEYAEGKLTPPEPTPKEE